MRLFRSFLVFVLLAPSMAFASTGTVQLTGSCQGNVILADEILFCAGTVFSFSIVKNGDDEDAHLTIPVTIKTGEARLVTFIATDSHNGDFEAGVGKLYQVVDTVKQIIQIRNVSGKCISKIDALDETWAKIVCKAMDADGRNYAVELLSRPR